MKSHKLRGVQKKEKQRWKEREKVINLSSFYVSIPLPSYIK
jgi:hypothetical protein